MALTLWAGRGIWEGWSIRKHYESCKFGDSVLVDPDGIPYKPSDIISSFEMKSKRIKEEKNNDRIVTQYIKE